MPTCRWYTKAEAHAANEILSGYASRALRAAHQNDSAQSSSQLERLGESNNNALPLLRSAAVSIDCEDITAQFFDGCAFLLIGGE